MERYQRVRAVFDEAVLIEPPARNAYLDRTCGDDIALRSEVIRLLVAHENAGSYLDRPFGVWPSSLDDEPFGGTDRFRVVNRLGAGGMGVVYEVEDGVRSEIVALKTLRRTSAANVYRLKQEFRSLADVTHRNLACLYELFVEDDRCYFTMELVRGVSFVDYVRGVDGATASRDRLVDALRQLIDGVSALHRKGKLHRDIKPSNVLVTSDGRVVILDFGLIAEVATASAGEGRHVRGGTPAYMSPEEAAGSLPSDASDWYGVGVTLYEALTGRIPFDGRASDILMRKATTDPLPPVDIAPARVPQDLSDICMGLLQRSPERRLNGAAVLAALSGDTWPASASQAATSQDTPFVGRQRELQALDDARDEVSRGAAKVVAVYGPSGIGKSALVRRFLTEAVAQGDVVVLAGRCYENETVPYKALDGVIDDLSRYLGSLQPGYIEALLPSDIFALARVFPVLLQVDGVIRACRNQPFEDVDPLRVRGRAFDALGAMLRGLASRGPLVVWIDDLQWADADSIVVLEELLGTHNPPAILMVLSFRSEEIGDKPFLRSLLDRARPALFLEPMTAVEAQMLIRGMLPDASTLTDQDELQMTREAAGSPFVLEQLALHAAGAGSGGVTETPTFARMFDARLEALSLGARQFLETLVICGRPMAPEIVCDACGIARDRQSLVVMLRASRFIRSSGSAVRVEAYHDRIREVICERLAPDATRQIHLRMAASLVARRSDDCEALFEHYRGAGDAATAAVQAGLAGQKAATALAFDRAASFYAHALELSPSSGDAQAWREERATALANAGRPADAAEAYLRAAEGAERGRNVELQRRAAEQFLTGGYIDRGLDLIQRVLERVDLTPARNPLTAMLWLLWRRARLDWRGSAFVPKRIEDVDPNVLLRLDTCWAAAIGLGLVDLISASNFIARHLHLALDAGELSRIARGMALESAARQTDWPFRRTGARLAQRARALASETGTPQAIALELLADGVAACATGKWKRARIASEESLAILRDRCVGVTWELTIAQNVFIWSLMYLGELGEVCRRVPPLLAEARRQGNRYLATELCTRSNFVWLAADDPDGGEREVQEAVALWSQKGFHRQHYSAMLARVQTALYRGDGETAWRLLREHESRLRGSMLRRVQVLRVEWLYLRGRSALAVASADRSRNRFVSLARRDARRIARERMPWSNPIALLLDAAVASLEGRHAAALRGLEDAAAQFDHAEMALYAAVTRRRISALRQDDRGRQLREEADAWMAAQHVRNADGLTRMFAPGFPD